MDTLTFHTSFPPHRPHSQSISEGGGGSKFCLGKKLNFKTDKTFTKAEFCPLWKANYILIFVILFLLCTAQGLVSSGDLCCCCLKSCHKKTQALQGTKVSKTDLNFCIQRQVDKFQYEPWVPIITIPVTKSLTCRHRNQNFICSCLLQASNESALRDYFVLDSFRPLVAHGLKDLI